MPSWTKDTNAVRKSTGLVLFVFFAQSVVLELCRTGSTVRHAESRENGECKSAREGGRREKASVIVCVCVSVCV